MSFIARWSSDIWPAVQDKYTHVLAQRPARQDVATGQHYGQKLYEVLASKKEVRNVACNLAFTDPTGNTMLQKNISFVTVERFAIDMCVDTASATPDAEHVAA